ncbi:hypothetical protein DFP72DRAFT_1046976 [Ephemerocybe angulata]|uniref:Uncharacterized protein n=1 Tax=Ephemerocybe angulata TaxID=980116 RepID=A0A8H6HW01_9AGAR|nr:hypothetical protein DFP72DRAFT_1046976 [Tulosesus angulatus]
MPRSQERSISLAPSLDSRGWPPSTVPPRRKICKTWAVRQYKLDPDMLDGLTYVERPSKCFINGRFMPMFLYSEREVERLAWEVNGGPEGFNARLAELEAAYATSIHAAKGGKFQRPRTYGPSSY